MNRRDLLKACAALTASSFSTQLLAVLATQNRLLMVFLRGGYDASNLLSMAASCLMPPHPPWWFKNLIPSTFSKTRWALF